MQYGEQAATGTRRRAGADAYLIPSRPDSHHPIPSSPTMFLTTRHSISPRPTTTPLHSTLPRGIPPTLLAQTRSLEPLRKAIFSLCSAHPASAAETYVLLGADERLALLHMLMVAACDTIVVGEAAEEQHATWQQLIQVKTRSA